MRSPASTVSAMHLPKSESKRRPNHLGCGYSTARKTHLDVYNHTDNDKNEFKGPSTEP
jgi:hypothetical protein